MKNAPDNSQIDETLRLLAHAPVPAGLEDRVRAALKSAPAQGRLPAWPAAAGSGWFVNWARAAAAAAIALVVAGGGWSVYQHAQSAAARVAPAPVAQPVAGSGFASAGAMRTPQTVKGPAVEKRQVGEPAGRLSHPSRKERGKDGAPGGAGGASEKRAETGIKAQPANQ